MVKSQHPYVDDKGIAHDNEIKFYSDKGFQIVQRETGGVFDFAIDPYPSKYNYDESDVLVEDNLSTTEEKAKAYDIMMGVSE